MPHPRFARVAYSSRARKTSDTERGAKQASRSAKEKVAQSAKVSYNFSQASKETPKTTIYGGTLPNTGEKEGVASTLGLVVIAAGITGLTLGFKKRNDK